MVNQFTAIPWDTPVFIEKAAGRLACKFRSQNMEVIKTASLAEPIESKKLRFVVDAGYIKYFELPSGKKVYI